MTLKIYRDKKVNSDEVDYHKRGSFKEEAACIQGSTIACIAQIEQA